MTPTPPLRIALSVTSGASLGAFEAGAVAGLLTALQRLNEGDAARRTPASVRLDAIGATSAGAMVGLLGARALLDGLDPVHVLHEAWVRRAGLRQLRRGRGDAPLSMTQVRTDAVELLDPRARRDRPLHRVPDAARQRSSIAYTVALGCLQGLTYRIPGHRCDPAVVGLTHVDRIAHVLNPEGARDRWVEPERASPLDAAIASMSHPGAFRPQVLDRRAAESSYRRAGVADFPESGHLWYADGSALLTRPLGATLDGVRRCSETGARNDDGRWLHVLVHPHVGAPASDGRWTDPGRPPAWTATVGRLLTTLTSEPLYADMARMEEVNARLRGCRQLADLLARHLPDQAVPDLVQVLEAVREESGGRAGSVPPSSRELLHAVLEAVSGVPGKLEIATEVISPLRLVDSGGVPSGQSAVPGLLAGEFLGHFGGFAARDLRQSDFVVGWRSLRAWLPDALARAGLPDERIREATAAVDERVVEFGPRGFRGGSQVRDLPLRTRVQLLGLAGRALRGAVSDLLGRPRSGS